MAEAVPITRVATPLTPVPRPPDALTAVRRTWLDEFALERTLEGSTALWGAVSNFYPQAIANPFLEETVHVTGVRFDASADGRSFGHLTLNGSNPIGAAVAHSTSVSGKHPQIYALTEDTYLLTKSGGTAQPGWERPSGIAWIIKVSASGAPTLVDYVIHQGPFGYNPYRNELLVINPTAAWFATTAYAGTLHPDAAADHGCFGIAVSPTGFGARSNYPDPPIPPSYQAANLTPSSNWAMAGIGIDGDSYVVGYRQRTSGGSLLRLAAYFPDSGTLAGPFTGGGAGPSDFLYFSSPGGEKGDTITEVPSVIYSGSWGFGRVHTISGIGVSYEPAAWAFELSTDENTVLGGQDAWDDRAFITGAQRGVGTYYRTLPLDPPYTSLADIWARNPGYASSYPTYEDFVSAFIGAFGSEAAAVTAFNGAGGVSSGLYFGFQDVAGPSTTQWGIWEVDADQNRIPRMLQRDGDVIYTLFPGFYDSGASAQVLPRIIRWDLAVPAIVGTDDGVRRRFV